MPAVGGLPFYDGSTLLTTAEVGPLLVAAVEHAGGTLTQWHLDHVDASPGRSTTATFSATVDWPGGPRRELLGASARVGGRRGNDERAVIFGDGEREVAVWLYPDDPDLPGLARSARPAALASLLTEHQVFGSAVDPAAVSVEMISYRPRRRAVVRATVARPTGPETLFVKVLPEAGYGPTLERHQLLLAAGVPAPVVAATTADFVLVLRPVVGRPLASAIFDEAMPCTADNMIRLLDSMPPAVAALPRRPPWTDAVATYADIVAAAAPSLQPQLGWLVGQIATGLAGLPLGVEPTHGDFHEGQLFVSRGLITGMIDIDTIGPGRRADDLACMIAHLSTVQRMTAEQAAGLTRLIALWLAAFDARVDPRELRLRAAGVIVSLATGPYRSQEPGWLTDTQAMINTAETLVRVAVG